MTLFADMADLPEDDRISVIGATAASGKIVGFIVETDSKADRYIRKLLRGWPSVRVMDRGPGPVAGTIIVRCTADEGPSS